MDIAIVPGAYQTLMEAALEALPAESFGALIGRSGTGMGAWGIIEEVAPVALIPVQAGLAPDMQQWHALEERLGNRPAGSENRRSILGWFYTDSAIGIFKPRTNVVQVADMLGANGALLLIVNPVARQGGFYVKMGDRFAPAGDFHEVLPEEGAKPVVPWTGEIQGVEEWLGDSYTTFAYSTGNIEDFKLPPNVPRRGSRFTAKEVQGAASADPGAPNEEAKESAGATDDAAKAANEAESKMARGSDGAGTPAADKRSGPITAPLPPLDRNGMVGGEQVREGGRRTLLVAVVVIGIMVVVLVSIALIYGFGGSSDPKIAGIAGPAQTATARTVSLALSPTAGLTAQPTATTLSIVAATTTPPPTSTTARIYTPTATTTSVPTSTATTAPSATPSPAVITYVVQPGDTLTYIARSFGITVDALMAANGLTSTEITVGQVLKIP